MVAIAQQKLTVAEFLEFCNLPENVDKRFELIDGEPVEMPPSSKRNTVLAMRIGRFIGNYVDPAHLGIVSGADGGYNLAPDMVRQPDLGFIAKARIGSMDGVVFEVAPDLAVEVISPSETANMVRNRVKTFLDAGCKRVWAVYSDSQSVDVHYRDANGQHAQTFTLADTLDGADALPGFTLKVADIFADML